ncbi:hypothetical protein BDQ94DRAFT_150615 [Aspergillus welwitschiae]|uniref:Uncharacterized protein n=1 Tax=Aspergillus welwitschiae TaxID=1341132 RepID=A0A3F3PQY3_9EURO|nr:hypothetical protein BDQ94DRAFT_150615 [Aspergillus welwitschiae]RDH29361.1 hypothetical protein BDQ94DRAFT_150615 [Aspergillus welwitschiae]
MVKEQPVYSLEQKERKSHWWGSSTYLKMTLWKSYALPIAAQGIPWWMSALLLCISARIRCNQCQILE